MAKFENQVALNKIGRLANKSSLLFFLNYKNQTVLDKKNNLGVSPLLTNQRFVRGAFKKSSIFYSPFGQNLNSFYQSVFLNNKESSIYKQNDFLTTDSVKPLPSAQKRQVNNLSLSFEREKDETVSLCLLKNNHLKKALQTNLYKSTQDSTSSAFVESFNVSLPEGAGVFSTKIDKIDKKAHEDDNHSLNLLLENVCFFKSNRLAVFYRKPFGSLPILAVGEGGPKSPARLSKGVRTSPMGEKQEKQTIAILGGLYEGTIIDHNQIKRLVSNSENNLAYFHFKKSLNQSLSIFFCFLPVYRKMTTLLKFKVQARA